MIEIGKHDFNLFIPFQIRLIHKSDYTLEERLMFKPIVFANTIQSMSIILHAVERLGKTFITGCQINSIGAQLFSNQPQF